MDDNTYSTAAPISTKPLTLADLAPLLERTRKAADMRRKAEAVLCRILPLNPIPIDVLTAVVRVVGPVPVYADPSVEPGRAYYAPREEHPWGTQTGGCIVASEEWLIGFGFDAWMARLERELMGGKS